MKNETKSEEVKMRNNLQTNRDNYTYQERLLDLAYVQVGSVKSEYNKEAVNVNDLLISATSVTQGQFKSLMGYNPVEIEYKNRRNKLSLECESRKDFILGRANQKFELERLDKYQKGQTLKLTWEDDLPVFYVSWYDAVEFCNRLSEMEGLIKCYNGSGEYTRCNPFANGYRLPTSNEFDYAPEDFNVLELQAQDKFGKLWYWCNSDSFQNDGSNYTLRQDSFNPLKFGRSSYNGNFERMFIDLRIRNYTPDPISCKLVRTGSSKSKEREFRFSNYSSERPENDVASNIGFRVVRRM
jgi:formylglycine-generating enzyme required for sulfatase activity